MDSNSLENFLNYFWKFQKDLDNVAESAKKRGNEMDNMEIQTLKIFMKQLANEYGDMEFLSRSINSEKDKEAAKQIGKDLRVVAREVDKALSDGRVERLAEEYPKMNYFFITIQKKMNF